jgi:hypothetical protein
MPTLQKARTPDPEQLLAAIDQIDEAELRPLVSRIVTRAARRMAPSLPEKESELLQRINQGLPEPVDVRFSTLVAKRKAATLTPAEHEELLELVDVVEAWQAARTGYLLKLAQLRDTSLSALMADLGIEPLPVE